MSDEKVCFLSEALQDAEANGFKKVVGSELQAISQVRLREAKRLKQTVVVEDRGSERRVMLLDPRTRKPASMIMTLRKPEGAPSKPT